MKDFELLSPAGSMLALRAGIQNGADAIYLGGTEFSARASANNFNREELIEAVEYARLRNVDIFVAVNTSIKENEIEKLIEYTDFLYKIGVSAIILSDIGVAKILRKRYPNIELHASTQISAHSLRDVFELQNVGFDRVVLARELTTEEIKNICENVSVDIEVFVHGALCVSYSGQCLMSSMLGKRSGNRGSCAQPCRQEYKLINTTKNSEVRSMSGMYLLSPKDLCSIENMTEILDTGVKSLKIEGRMKRPEYVAIVTSSYRKVLDEYLGSIKNVDKKELKNNLTISFNRGFTEGYLKGHVGSDNMNANKPNNTGIKLGEVIYFNNKTKLLKIKLFEKLSKGDCLNIGGGEVGRIIKNGKVFEVGNSGEIVEIDFIKNIDKGTIVFKTLDKALNDFANSKIKEGVEDKKVKLRTNISINVGEKIKFSLDEIEVFSENIVEQATGRKLDINNVVEKLSKTGNTPYIFEFDKIEIDENAFVPVSVLNNLRRDAILKYEEKMLDFSDRQIVEEKKEFKKIVKEESFGKITLKIHKNNQVDDLIEFLKINDDFIKSNLKEIYSEDFIGFKEYSEKLNDFGMRLIYSAPGILRNDEYDRLEKYLNRIDKELLEKVQVSTWGQKNWFKEKFDTKRVNMDTYFNVYNSNSIRFFFEDFEAENVTLSQEITRFEIEEALSNADYKNIDMIVYGHARSMITEYCPMGVITRDCHKDRRNVECARCDYVLRDKENRDFRLFQDIFCRTEIKNSFPLDLRNEVEDIFKIGVSRIRLDFTNEDSKEVLEIIKDYFDALKGKKFLLKNSDIYSHYYNPVD